MHLQLLQILYANSQDVALWARWISGWLVIRFISIPIQTYAPPTLYFCIFNFQISLVILVNHKHCIFSSSTFNYPKYCVVFISIRLFYCPGNLNLINCYKMLHQIEKGNRYCIRYLNIVSIFRNVYTKYRKILISTVRNNANVAQISTNIICYNTTTTKKLLRNSVIICFL